MKREDIENQGRIEREKVIKELQEGYNKHHDINLYTAASATIGQYALPLFVAGAKWRINRVWHDSTEKPMPGKLLLVNTLYGGYDLCYYGEYVWNTVMTWAYIKDLIPNTEE